MKKSLILILFTFICFITSTSEVFAASCWECYNRFNGKNEVKYYWSDGNPTKNGTITDTVILCDTSPYDETTCKSKSGTYSGFDEEKEEEDYLKENPSCYQLGGPRQKYKLFWGTSTEAEEYRKNNRQYSTIKQKNIPQSECHGEYDTQSEVNKIEDASTGGNGGSGGTGSLPNVGFGEEMSCSELLGPSLTKLVSILLDAFKIAAMILCTVQMMMALIPPITNKDSDALNKALKKCVTLAIIFVCALLIDTFVVVIGRLFGFDLSCFR